MNKLKFFIISVLMVCMLAGCNTSEEAKINAKLNQNTKDAKASVEGYINALKEANVLEMDTYVLGEDSNAMGLTKDTTKAERENMKAFYQFIEYKYVSGEIPDGEISGSLVYHIKSKSMPDLLEVASENNGLTINDIDDIENDVTFEMYKVNDKWIIKNGSEAFKKMVGSKK